jgi:hypothetical protein
MPGVFGGCEQLSALCLPASVKVLCEAALSDMISLTSLTFEPGSNLVKISQGAFSNCISLESIEVPPSVEIILNRAFSDLAHLTSLTFGPGSKLREIGEAAFCDCPSLKSILLPASLPRIEGSTFSGSSIETIRVDETNPNYFASGGFLVSFEGMTLIRYFKQDTTAVIGGDYGSIGPYCFESHKILSTVAFEDGSTLTSIGECAFANCPSLESICIPSSVEIIGESCFYGCTSLSQFTFQSGSRITHICGDSFRLCLSLSSICLPAQLESIPGRCFLGCGSLLSVTFETDSKLSRIGPAAFDECCSLRSFAIPASVEILEATAFRKCVSLSQLTFEIPSRLQKLSLPPSRFGSIYIPDSCEVVTGSVEAFSDQSRIIRFGRESRLRELALHELRSNLFFRANPALEQQRLFVCLSDTVLSRFRSKFEAL